MSEQVGLAAFFPQEHLVVDIEYDIDDPARLRFLFECFASTIVQNGAEYSIDDLERMIGSWCTVNLDAETGQVRVRSKPNHG